MLNGWGREGSWSWHRPVGGCWNVSFTHDCCRRWLPTNGSNDCHNKSPRLDKSSSLGSIKLQLIRPLSPTHPLSLSLSLQLAHAGDSDNNINNQTGNATAAAHCALRWSGPASEWRAVSEWQCTATPTAQTGATPTATTIYRGSGQCHDQPHSSYCAAAIQAVCLCPTATTCLCRCSPHPAAISAQLYQLHHPQTQLRLRLCRQLWQTLPSLPAWSDARSVRRTRVKVPAGLLHTQLGGAASAAAASATAAAPSASAATCRAATHVGLLRAGPEALQARL